MINRTLTTEEIDLLVDFAREYLQFAEEFAGPNYGPFCGGDPRNFEPDPEASTEQQREPSQSLRSLGARRTWANRHRVWVRCDARPCPGRALPAASALARGA